MTEFKATFETSSGELLVKDEPVAALDEDQIAQEQVVRHVRPPAQQKK